MRFLFGNNIRPEHDCFLVVKDNWDDYGYRTLFHISYQGSGLSGPFRIGSVKIACTEMPEAVFTKSISETKLPLLEFDQLPATYYSLGQSDEYYENLNKLEGILKISLHDEFYRGIRDVAYDLDIFEEVKDLPPFTSSLARSIPLATIQTQYHRIAHGGARLTEYNFSYIPHFSRDHNTERISFHVVPESIPSSNVYAIIGKNGAGKTSFLKRFAEDALTINSDLLIDEPQHPSASQFSHKQQYRPLFSNVVFIGFSAFDSFPATIEDFSRSELRKKDYTFIGLQHPPSNADHCQKLPANTLEVTQSLFSSALKSIASSPSKLELWAKATEPLAYDTSSPIYAARDQVEHGAINDACESFSHMSSGHKIALLTITSLVDHIVEKSLAIIDEPETHLHPPLLSALINSLSQVLTHMNGVALIATHSPIVLQEISSRCAWRLERSGDRSLLKPLGLETYGTDINTLTRDVFGFEIEKTGFHETIRNIAAESKGDWTTANKRITGELGSEGGLLLRALMTQGEEDL